MVVKRKDAPAPVVLACTLIPYDPRFELGRTLAEASGAVSFNHPYLRLVLRAGRSLLQPLNAVRGQHRHRPGTSQRGAEPRRAVWVEVGEPVAEIRSPANAA